MEPEASKVQVRRTAWGLIAATFCADNLLIDDLGAHRRIRLIVKYRLGTEASQLWRRWPNVYICVDGVRMRHTENSLDLTAEHSCVLNSHILDITPHVDDSSASISELPILVSSLSKSTQSTKSKSVLGERKSDELNGDVKLLDPR